MSMQNMVQDYYEILGTQPGASALDIKKAYFSLVRKYPPEQYPEEFKRIREAYEVLSNEESRKEYDLIAALPSSVKNHYNYAREVLDDENYELAISLLEDLMERVPDKGVIKGLLSEAYLGNGNSGKAIRILEELVKEHPQNAGFNGHLAHAYLMRGWHKKSLDVFRRAISMDEDNLSLWYGLSEALVRADCIQEAQEVILEALERGKEKGWDNVGLYFQLAQLDILMGDDEAMERHLEELVSQAAHREDIKESIGWALRVIAELLAQLGRLEKGRVVLNWAASLLPHEQDLQELVDELGRYDALREIFHQLEEDEDIHKDIISLIAVSIIPNEILEEDELQAAGLFFNELAILEEAQHYLFSIKLLEKRYPRLYTLREEFFEGVRNRKTRKKMLKTYEKNLPYYSAIMEQGLGPAFGESEVCEHCGEVHGPGGDYSPVDFHEEFEDDYEDDYEDDFNEWFTPQEPYVREQPKIGRNEPCPCDSGKKYKKCCGKS